MTTLATLADNFAPDTKGLSAQPYLDGSIFMEGFGTRGAKPRPFNYHLAVRQFHHWAYAAAMMNANAVAGVSLRMYARRREGRGRKMYETRAVSRSTARYLSGRTAMKPSMAVQSKMAAWGYDVEEVVEPHPAMMLLERPNPNDNGYEMTLDRVLDEQITGNFWWYVVDSRLGTPRLLYRLPPQWTHVVPNDEKTGENRVSGYIYGKNTANEIKLTEAEVDHFRMPNPKDSGLFYGMGWVEAAWQSLGLHNAKRTEDLAMKDNMSRPDWILSAEGGSPGTIDRLESAMKTKFRGPENVGNFLVTAGKLTATALQWEQKELGTPTRLIEEIAAISGVPVSMLLSNDPNKAGSETAQLQWYRSGVRPYCLRDEQKLNQRYIPRFAGSEDYFVCYDHVSFEDRAAVTKEVVSLTSGGIISPNEARQELGYQDAEGADFLYPPAGNTGGSASAMGNMSSEQNDERRDRKGLARMPKVDGGKAQEESDLQFKRDVFLQLVKDPTIGDAIANMADAPDLMDAVGIKRKEGMDIPVLPIVSVMGPVVNGQTIKIGDTIVGGAAGNPPPELITVTDKETNGKPDKTPVAPKPADQGGSDASPPADQGAAKAD